MTARPVLMSAGFTGEAVDIMLGIGWTESFCVQTKLGGYTDAIGDWWQLLDPAIAAKWQVSVGWFQIRALVDPDAWGAADRWRVRDKLLDPLYNAQAAYAISGQGTRFTPWSVFNSDTYLPHKGRDYELRTGHTHTCSQFAGVHPSFWHFNDPR